MKKYSLENILLLIFFVLIIILPPIKLLSTELYISVSDIFLPIIFFFTIRKQQLKNNLKIIFAITAISLFILFSILINCQAQNFNNYFEIYKIFKFSIIYIFVKEAYYCDINKKPFDILFIFILIFNILHYFNILDFNKFVMPIYCGNDNLNLIYFGLNSIGENDTKRMIGTIANPNMNAILIILFLINYFPKKTWSTKNIILFFCGIIALLACQSRTGLMILILILIINYLLEKIRWNKLLIQIFAIACTMFIFFNILDNQSNKYINTLNDASAFTSKSWQDRVTMWKYLINETSDCKIIWGNSPNKNFLYENKIHADNEYVLIFYQYGIIGIIIFLSMLILPAIKSLKHARDSIDAKNLLLISAVFAISAITNAPFHNHITTFMYIFALAIFYKKHCRT